MDLQMKRLRKAHGGMSQRELAEAVGTTLRVVSSWERGETALSLEDACRVADVFDCTLDELAGRQWPPGGESSPMTAVETGLIEDYRRMDDSDKPAFISTAHALAFVGDAKKEELGVVAAVDRQPMSSS